MAHAFWRINVSANDGDTNYLAIAEVEMRASVGGADQCAGGTASASASDGTSPPSNAFDNNATTRWSTPVGTLTGWLAYQFSSAVDVLECTIRAHPTSPARSPRTGTIEYSDDGVAWIVLLKFGPETGWTNGQVRTFLMSAVSARLSQVAVEVLRSPDPDPWLSQVAVEVLSINVPDAPPPSSVRRRPLYLAC